MKRLLFCFTGLVCVLAGADWLSSGGDAQRTGWQRRGKSIGPGNAGELKPLWKLALDNQSRGLNSLTAPVMLGPIVTHRGVKELVFIGGASDNLYAVDADRGRLFWKRHLDAPVDACSSGLTATPVLAPPPPGTKIRDDDEGTTPMRPFYFVASDGVLRTIRPADGVDMAPGRRFVPAGAKVSALNLFGRFLYAGAGGCGAPDVVWSIDTGDPAEVPASFRAGSRADVSVGSDGTVYSGSMALTPGPSKKKWTLPVSAGAVAPIPFSWGERELVAAVDGAQGLVLLDRQKIVARANADGDIRGMASWEDGEGSRWIYLAASGRVEAYRVMPGKLERAWVAGAMTSPAAPVIANGVLLVLDCGGRSAHAVLYALNAASGKELYSSGDAVGSFVSSSGLAVANGHICFGTWDNVLYCFGFPIEI